MDKMTNPVAVLGVFLFAMFNISFLGVVGYALFASLNAAGENNPFVIAETINSFIWIPFSAAALLLAIVPGEKRSLFFILAILISAVSFIKFLLSLGG